MMACHKNWLVVTCYLEFTTNQSYDHACRLSLFWKVEMSFGRNWGRHQQDEAAIADVDSSDLLFTESLHYYPKNGSYSPLACSIFQLARCLAGFWWHCLADSPRDYGCHHTCFILWYYQSPSDLGFSLAWSLGFNQRSNCYGPPEGLATIAYFRRDSRTPPSLWSFWYCGFVERAWVHDSFGLLYLPNEDTMQHRRHPSSFPWLCQHIAKYSTYAQYKS